MARVKEYNKKEDPLRSVAAGSFATGSNNVKEGSNKRAERKTDRCMLCKNTHNLDECDKFANFEMPKTESKGSESQLILEWTILHDVIVPVIAKGMILIIL